MGDDFLPEEPDALNGFFRVHPQKVEPKKHVLRPELVTLALDLPSHVFGVADDDAFFFQFLKLTVIPLPRLTFSVIHAI